MSVNAELIAALRSITPLIDPVQMQTFRAVLREVWLTRGSLLGKEIYVRFQAATTGFLTFPGSATGTIVPVADNVVWRR